MQPSPLTSVSLCYTPVLDPLGPRPECETLFQRLERQERMIEQQSKHLFLLENLFLEEEEKLEGAPEEGLTAGGVLRGGRNRGRSSPRGGRSDERPAIGRPDQDFSRELHTSEFHGHGLTGRQRLTKSGYMLGLAKSSSSNSLRPDEPSQSECGSFASVVGAPGSKCGSFAASALDGDRGPHHVDSGGGGPKITPSPSPAAPASESSSHGEHTVRRAFRRRSSGTFRRRSSERALDAR